MIGYNTNYILILNKQLVNAKQNIKKIMYLGIIDIF